MYTYVHVCRIQSFASGCLDAAYTRASCVIARLVFRFTFIVLLNVYQASISVVCFDMDEVPCLVLLGIRIKVHIIFVNCCRRCRCVDFVNGPQNASQ